MALRPATFRNVPFHVEVTNLEAGRRTVTHEYPFRDVPFVEDLGRRARRFSIDGYVIGADWQAQRDALHAALEEPGAGTLVHPSYGSRLVVCTGLEIDEDQQDGRRVRFRLEFTETQARAFSPTSTRVPLQTVQRSAEAARLKSRSDFVKLYRVTTPVLGAGAAIGRTKPLPSFALASASRLIGTLSTRLHGTLAPLVRGTQAVAAFRRQVEHLVSDAVMLARTPASLAARMTDLFTGIAGWTTSGASAPRQAAAGLLAAYAATPSVFRSPSGFVTSAQGARPSTSAPEWARPVAITPTRTAEQANYDALTVLVQRELLIQAAVFAAEAADVALPTSADEAPTSRAATGGYDTYEAAVLTRDALVAAIEEQMTGEPDAAVASAASLTTADMFAALVQLRADVVAAIPGASQRLPRLMAYTPSATVPALVLAYQLYGSIALADDLATRNRVRHPGFVIGGHPLQVLSHG